MTVYYDPDQVQESHFPVDAVDRGFMVLVPVYQQSLSRVKRGREVRLLEHFGAEQNRPTLESYALETSQRRSPASWNSPTPNTTRRYYSAAAVMTR